MVSTRYFTLGFVTIDCTLSQHGAQIARTVRHFPDSISHTVNSTEDFQSIKFSHRGQNITRPTEAHRLCFSISDSKAVFMVQNWFTNNPKENSMACVRFWSHSKGVSSFESTPSQ